MLAGERCPWRTAWDARTLRRDELSAVLQATGFGQVRWLMPRESGFYQPIVTARRRAG